MSISRDALASLQDRLQDPDTFATTLLVVAMDAFNEDGEDVHTWSLETLAQEFREEFHVELPSCNLDKLMAAVLVRTTDRFYKSLPVFIHLCNILSGDEFDPNVWNPATVKEMAWAITESLLLYPPDEDEPFAAEIVGYIGAMLAREGFYTTCPSVLRFALAPAGDVLANFRDPQQGQAWHQGQTQRAQEIDAIVQEGVRDLLEQLSHLPLQQGNTADLLKALRG